ncbi:MAG: hypothetical protein Hals2KO_27440 [Halioglobus sp.]
MLKLPGIGTALLISTTLASAVAAAPEDSTPCERQAEAIVQRLQAEVTGALDNEQRAAARQIVIAACDDREKAADLKMQQAVDDARAEEQESARDWLTESADKEGNQRLKRKSH